ncbi:hypothetical protein ABZ442_24850 [Streptomyces triculaminicus]|uniref:hypothetical protein n=1 Tax=Streptomyces triculaminicus TaxID=2816232 RepID=UPI0033F4FAD1
MNCSGPRIPRALALAAAICSIGATSYTAGAATPSASAAGGPPPCWSGPAAHSSRTFDLPGRKPTTTLYADVCADRSGEAVRGAVDIYWQIDDDRVQDNGKRFTSVRITSRLERRTGASGADQVVATRTCDVTDRLNKDYSSAVALSCTTPWTGYDPAYRWSGDATVTVDIEGDGKGPVTWELPGSPLTT